MARPRRDANGPSARGRLSAALLSSLETLPYRHITVTALCRAAGVNHNTFYYHYHSLDELACDAIDHSFDRLSVAEVLRLAGIEDETVNGIKPTSDDLELELRRVMILAGPHGAAWMAQAVSWRVQENIYAWLDRPPGELSAADRAAIAVMASGVVAEIAGGTLGGSITARSAVPKTEMGEGFIRLLRRIKEGGDSPH